jgi:membrane AbrB-like protein
MLKPGEPRPAHLQGRILSRPGIGSPGSASPFGLSGGLAKIALTFLLAVAGGAAANWLNMPLPWMLGPLFACGAAAMLGYRPQFVPHGRELGQVAVGLAVGMRFTPAVLAATAALLPHMAAAAIYVITCTTLAALLFAALANVDHKTAFFATAAGGMADMAVVAEERGGDPGAVSITHAIRVASVVAVVPFLVFAFGESGSATGANEAGSDSLFLLGLALLLAYATAHLFRFTPIPNPWLVGPIILGTLLGASGLLTVQVPWTLIVLAQIVIGTWLGCRFRREIIARLPRVALAALGVSLLLVAAAAAGAAVLSSVSPLPFTTSFLSLAPAAVTEMVITAQAMDIDAQIVTAFHVMRIAVVSSTVLLVFALFRKLVEVARGSPI